MRRFALLVLLLSPLLAFAQGRGSRAPWGIGQSRPEDLQITLVTFGPGPEIISWFGHSALVVEDTRLGQRRLYNYGMFGFEKPGMLVKFAMGRLEFWVEDTPYVVPTFRFYASEQRDVILQLLNLSPAQRAQLAQALDENVQPQNRYYLYHHYFDNCSTRPRDMIDRATGGVLSAIGAQPARMTLREHTRRHTDYFPPMSVLLDFLMNDEIDQPITRYQEAFLPAELMHQVDEAKVTLPDGTVAPLVAEKITWFEGKRPKPPETPPKYGPALLAIGLLLGAPAVLWAVWYRRSRGRAPRILLGVHNVLVGLVLGLPGTVLLLMGTLTEHTVTHHNENLLLANPLTLLAVPFGIGLMRDRAKSSRALRAIWVLLAGMGVLELLLKALPWFDQDNWRIIALVLPISLGFAAASVVYEASRHAERSNREDDRAPPAPRRAPGDSLTSTANVRASR
ncbi:MAG: DUF4105 domain-containing protein [Myxococcaceae bacterium]|nr:DUF4105 domain-containing protein [Myxococcaceae bacterium]